MEDNNKYDDNNKDNSDNKSISALELDRDLGFSLDINDTRASVS